MRIRLAIKRSYADQLGAVAAPTAGLHFDEKMLEDIQAKGASVAFCNPCTLEPGLFSLCVLIISLTIRCTQSGCRLAKKSVIRSSKTKTDGGRVIAVGTTSVRCLETASRSGQIAPFEGDTNIFIYPGYRFNVVDGLLTNFHLSESTLLMLVQRIFQDITL